MSKTQSLFGEEELQKITTIVTEEENVMPLIFTEKRRHLKMILPLKKK